MQYYYVIRCRIAFLGILSTNTYNFSRMRKRGNGFSGAIECKSLSGTVPSSSNAATKRMPPSIQEC